MTKLNNYHNFKIRIWQLLQNIFVFQFLLEILNNPICQIPPYFNSLLSTHTLDTPQFWENYHQILQCVVGSRYYLNSDIFNSVSRLYMICVKYFTVQIVWHLTPGSMQILCKFLQPVAQQHNVSITYYNNITWNQIQGSLTYQFSPTIVKYLATYVNQNMRYFVKQIKILT